MPTHCLPEYGFVALPQIRVLIDCLYNAVLLLEDPVANGKKFRADGYRQLFSSISEAEQGLSNDAENDQYLQDMRSHYELSQRIDALSDEEVAKGSWPTFSSYVKHNDSTNAIFLRRFSFGLWKQYSAISHATFWGLTHIAPFLRRDRELPENREWFRQAGMKPLSLHLLRASYVFLCILTELEGRLQLGDHARVKQD